MREKDGVFTIAGLANPAKVRADLFNNLNNPGKVSTNLLTDADVQELTLEGKTLLCVNIPQATRKQRPVFLNGQPLGHTYKRLNDGDRLCDEETVKRLPVEQVIRGGESDCRNRILHQMFLLIGLGERGGSGMPKIYSGWQSRHWRQPLLREKDLPEQTLLELHMLDLLPETVLAELRSRLGGRFDGVSPLERMILATAVIEGVVNHARMAEICSDHPHDLSLALARLEREGLLLSQGQSRGKVYHLPGSVPVSAEQVFTSGPSSGSNEGSSSSNGGSSGSSSGSSGDRAPPETVAPLVAPTDASPKRDEHGCLLSPLLDAPIVDDLAELTPALRQELENRAAMPRARPRLAPEVMSDVILSVCEGRYVRLSVLAELLDRNADGLRRSYLDALVKDHRIRRAFPGTPTHEMQSYRKSDEQ